MHFLTSAIIIILLFFSRQGRVQAQPYECFDPDGVDLKTAADLYNDNNWSGSLNNKNFGPIEDWCTERVTNMAYLFWDKRNFNADISKWNVSSVTSMDNMFVSALKFNQDLSGWSTSKVTNMRSMFSGAVEFDSDITTWDVSSVVNMEGMFMSTHKFNQDISQWDVSKVGRMLGMFKNARAFDKDIGGWDVSSVTSFNFAFYYTQSFNQDISQWDISASEDMKSMFGLAWVFNQPLCAWKFDLPYGEPVKDIFHRSACTNTDTPTSDQDAFCAGTASECQAYTRSPTSSPSSRPSLEPSLSGNPSSEPSLVPSESSAPSSQPSMEPSLSGNPTSDPSLAPSESSAPSSQPSSPPSSPPSSKPSLEPSSMPSSEPSSEPSATPSCSPTVSPSKPPGINLYYPNFVGGEDGCRNDGGEPDYMLLEPTSWLSSSKEACCKKFFGGFLYDNCMGLYLPNHDDCNIMLYYPDWEGSNIACINDGMEPYYMMTNHPYFLFTSLKECCEQFYHWDIYTCTGEMPVLTNGEFYPDWEKESGTCSNDNKMPKYMITQQQWYLSKTKKECCEHHYSYAYKECMGEDAQAQGTDKWYVDWFRFTCVQDCNGSPPCGGIAESWKELFTSKEKCCREKIGPWGQKDCIAMV